MKSFFSRYFTTHLLILLLSLAAVSLFSIISMREFLFSDNQERQLEFTRTVASMITMAQLSHGMESDYINNIDREGTFRITLIKPDGKVIADTDADWRLLDNHRNRPEVLQALNYGQGQSRRLSKTLRESLLYTAVYNKQEDIIVRVSMVVGNIDRMVAILAFRVVFLTLLVLLLALFISFRQTRSINRMLTSIVAVVTDYARGDFRQNLYLGGFKEAIEVGDAVNSMGRQLQEKLETITIQKNKSEAILKNMVEPVLYLDNNLMINDINRAALEMTGCSLSQCLGRNILQIIRNIELCRLVEDCLEKNTPMAKVISVGTRHFMVQTTTIEKGDEGEKGVLLVMSDVTEIKQMEIMRKDFVSNVSHELRTPVTSIIGFVETLRSMKEERSEQQEKFLKIIQSQSYRLGEIINDLLSLASLEEDKTTLNKESVKVYDIVTEAESVCRIKAEERNISFNHDFDRNLHIKCHRNLTEQALVNYLDNAIKYGPENSIVTIRAEKEGDYMVLSVLDRGKGIRPEQQERLFERFYRVDKARSREVGGTGLGLSIVKHIAIKHGGKAGVESSPERGSRFYIALNQS
jgi:two-component system phosphate regulon sensor histidine kinase PhoR